MNYGKPRICSGLRCRLRSHHLLKILFLASLCISLFIAQPLSLAQVRFSGRSPSSRLALTWQTQQLMGQAVQQGVEAYHIGHFSKAQLLWETALKYSDQSEDRLVILENLARVASQLGQFPTAINYWQQALQIAQEQGDRSHQASLKIEQAQTYSHLGQHRRALDFLCGHSESANTKFNVLVEKHPTLDAAEYPACDADSALAIAIDVSNRDRPADSRSDNPRLRVAALGSLGETHRALGNYSQAEAYLQQAHEEMQLFPLPHYQLSVLQGLGRLYNSQAKQQYRRAEIAEQIGDLEIAVNLRHQAIATDKQAQQFFEQGLEQIQTLRSSETPAQQRMNELVIPTTWLDQELKFLIDLIPIYSRNGQSQLRDQFIRRAMRRLEHALDSQTKAFSAISLAQLLTSPQKALSQSPATCLMMSPKVPLRDVARLLEIGLTVAERIDDHRAEAFAQGNLGHLAECQGNYPTALQRTQAARIAASQDPLGKDSLYLWDWQLGRIWQAQNRKRDAMAAYRAAIATLNDIRGDILTADPELRFDFRETIEPIYRQLAELSLEGIPSSQLLTQVEQSNNAGTGNRSQIIRSTLKTVDSLKLAELQNYFGSDCVITPTTAVLDVGTQQADTAVINTITFTDRTAVIASFPNGASQVEWIDLGQASLRETVNSFRRGLESYFRDFEPQLAQQLYGWLVRPFEAQLAAANVHTLVFVNDGILRSVPMAALHDGEGFLVERYAIATTPSLELTDPKPPNRGRLRALAVGLTDAVTIDEIRFEPLPFVEQEVESVATQVTGTQTFLNEAFSRERLQQELSKQRYPILHVATHGKFGAEPENNFIVTGTGEKLTISELDRLIRQLAPTGEPIELLALTACETAIGDERATLGLAGVAIRAGARSALASLWSVGDQVTAELVEQFYKGLLDPQSNKAEALQAAQVALIQQGGEVAHPARWAPLILIGNWL